MCSNIYEVFFKYRYCFFQLTNISHDSQWIDEVSTMECDFENFGHLFNFSELSSADIQLFEDKNEYYEKSDNQVNI